MSKKDSLDSSSLLDFIEDTKNGKYSKADFSIQELVKCTITRDEISYISNDDIQTNVTILYGIN